MLGGSAVFEAANALLAKIRAAAGARLGCAAEQIELADGCARAADGRSLAFAQLAADGLRVTTAFGNDNRLTYTYGSAAAHVAVAPGTGDVELLDCLVVEDVGRIVNPLTLHGQAIGGMVQGLGGAFLEDLVYDAKGQLLAGNLADYLIPTARRRRSTEKRAQDARASDGAPIGASVTAIVAGCGAADTLGLPLGQVRVLHGSTPFLDGLGLHPVALVVPHVSPLVPSRVSDRPLSSAISPGASAVRAPLPRGATRRPGCGTSTTRSAIGRRAISSPNSAPSEKKAGSKSRRGPRNTCCLQSSAPTPINTNCGMLSLFVAGDAAAVAFRVSAGFGAACSRFSLSDGPNRSNWRMDAPAPPTGQPT